MSVVKMVIICIVCGGKGGTRQGTSRADLHSLPQQTTVATHMQCTVGMSITCICATCAERDEQDHSQ